MGIRAGHQSRARRYRLALTSGKGLVDMVLLALSVYRSTCHNCGAPVREGRKYCCYWCEFG